MRNDPIARKLPNCLTTQSGDHRDRMTDIPEQRASIPPSRRPGTFDRAPLRPLILRTQIEATDHRFDIIACRMAARLLPSP